MIEDRLPPSHMGLKQMQPINLPHQPTSRSLPIANRAIWQRLFASLVAYPAIVTTTAVFLVYLLTVAPDLSQAHLSGDGGELITASQTLGIPHPTGYPTYTLLSKLFSYLPVGTIAYRYNLFSALTTALAAGFVTATARGLLNRPSALGARPHDSRQQLIAAIVTGLLFAWTPLVWSQATITEVYGLNILLVSAVVWATVTQSPIWVVGLLYGLAFTTHATSLLLFPLVVYRLLKIESLSQLRHFLLACLLGLLPLALLPWLGQTSGPVVWGTPTTIEGWWWLVSGQLYQPNVLAITMPKLEIRLWEWGEQLLSAFTWLGLPLIIWSLILSFRSRQINLQGVLWLTAVLVFLYALGYNTFDAHVLLLPVLLILALLLSNSLQQLGPLALLLPLTLLLLHFPQQNLRHYPTLRPTATMLLAAAPADAILMTPGDTTIFTLWYFHHVEQMRPDLRLVDINLFAFDWYRARLTITYPELQATQVDDLAAFQRDNKRPFCTVTHHAAPLASEKVGGNFKLSCNEDSNP